MDKMTKHGTIAVVLFLTMTMHAGAQNATPAAPEVLRVTRYADDGNEGSLRWAIEQKNVRYLGMIGSKRKVISIYRELENEGMPREKFRRVRAPVGLDIGAITPEEIAVAIVGELIAIRRHAEGNVPQKRWTDTAASPESTSEPHDAALRSNR